MSAFKIIFSGSADHRSGNDAATTHLCDEVLEDIQIATVLAV